MSLLEAEAEKPTQAVRYERNEQRQGYRSGHYNRNLTTTSGNVTLKVSSATKRGRCRIVTAPSPFLCNIKNKSEPIANRHKVRICSLWWARQGSNPRPIGYEPTALTS